MIGGRPAVVVDTNVFGAELTRRGAALADAYRGHVEGRSLFISFVTVAEISYGARLARWGELRLRSLEARLGAAEIVWAESGLVDAYVSIRQECAVSGHALGQKHHEADRWWRRPLAGSTCRWLPTTPCSVTLPASRSSPNSSDPGSVQLGEEGQDLVLAVETPAVPRVLHDQPVLDSGAEDGPQEAVARCARSSSVQASWRGSWVFQALA